MKIGFINNAYFPTRFGGSEVSVQLLADAVVRKGHQAAVLTITPNPGQYEEREVKGIRVVYLPHKNLYSPPSMSKNPLVRVAWHLLDSYNPFMGADVSRWLKEENPELVHTNILGGISVSAWDAVRRHGAALVHSLREFYLQCRLMSLNRKGEECQGVCALCQVCAVPRRARSHVPDAVVGISRHVLESHLNAGFFPGVPVREVIYNPFRASDFSLKSKSSSAKLRLGFIGRIERLKGIDFLLEEIKTLPRDQYELYIGGVGDTPYTEEARKRDLGIDVHWLGFVEPSDFFQKIDVLIVPSLWQEPFGRVVVESYWHGVPVVISRRGGMPEIVDENVTGFLFEPDQPGDFQQLVRKLTPEKIKAMAPACIEKSRNFEPDLIADKYLDLFSRVLKNKRAE